jgi:hypothetical protein
VVLKKSLHIDFVGMPAIFSSLFVMFPFRFDNENTLEAMLRGGLHQIIYCVVLYVNCRKRTLPMSAVAAS